MAKTKIGGITVEIGADTSNLSKKLKDVNTESKKTQSELKSIDAALKQAPNSVELWNQKQEALTKAVENSKKKLEALLSEQANLEKGLQDETITPEVYKAFQREVEITKGQIETAEKALEDFTNSQNEAGDAAKEAGNDVQKAGEQAEASSEGFTVLKGAVAKLAADGFEKLMQASKEAWEEIDSGYDTIITKTGATGEQLKGLQKTADSVFASLPVEMTNVGDAIGEINTRFGATDDELQALTEHFLEYSKINSTAVSGSVRNVSGIIKAYGEDAKNTGNILGVLTSVSQRTGKETSSLESELLSNSATFKEMGLNIRQSAELLGQFEINGIDTSTALAGLKKAQQNATAEGKTLSDTLSESIEGIKNAETETEALQAATELFGSKGAAAMTQAIREQRFSVDDLSAGYEGMATIVSDTFEMTQSAPDKVKVALNNLKLELAKLAEAVLPKVEAFIDKGVKNLPKIEKTAKDLLPLVKGIGAAYATWKVTTLALQGADAVTKLSAAVKSGDTMMKALNATMSANPAVAVTAGIVGLTVALGALYMAQKEEQTIGEAVSERYKEQYEAINNVRDEINKMKDDFNSRARDIEAETARTESLWNELDKLTDASGRVLDKDKERAKYLLGELNEALGTEYTMTENQIDGYKKLSAEIDTVIAKKQAEALLDEYLAMDSSMLKKNAESLAAYEEARSEYNAARAEEGEARADYERLTGGNLKPEDYIKGYEGGNPEGYAAAQRYKDVRERKVGSADTMKQNEYNYAQSMNYLKNLDDAQRAVAEGRYNDVKKILYAQEDANKEILKNSEGTYEEINSAWKSSLEKANSDLELALKYGRQKEVEEVLKAMVETVKLGKQAGLDTTEAFTKEFIDGVQQMVDKGFDITELAEWGKDSGIDIADVFGDNYKEVIQKQLDEGYDIHALLEWAFNSGKMSGDEYIKFFKQMAQLGIDGFGDGVDIAGMIAWAERTGRSIGDITGENFRKALGEWTKDIFNNNPYEVHHVNSPGDVKHLGVDYELGMVRKHAAGGFEGIGGVGIVAEAGPELLQVMNGGVKITPLTGTARNTPVGAGEKTVIYNFHNSIEAKISSRYDIDDLAEDLSTAQKRIAQGQGR